MVDALAAVIVPSAAKLGLRVGCVRSRPRAGSSSVSTVSVVPLRPAGRRDDLALEESPGDGGLGAAIAVGRPRVLRLASDMRAARAALGGAPHVEIVVGIPEAVEDHRVEHRARAHAVPLAGARQEMRRARHALHPAGGDDVGLVETDGLRSQHDRHEPRAAHLVDGERAVGTRDAGAEPRLAGRRLSEPGADDVPHDDLLDRLGRHTGPLDRSLERRRAELGCRQTGERAAEAADRRAGGADEMGCAHRAILATSPGPFNRLDALRARPPQPARVVIPPARRSCGLVDVAEGPLDAGCILAVDAHDG
jgi:hypothetical protein